MSKIVHVIRLRQLVQPDQSSLQYEDITPSPWQASMLQNDEVLFDKLSKTNNSLGETGDLQLNCTLLAGDELYLGWASVTVEPLVYVTFQCDYLHCLSVCD